jgi:hypothetical protein
MHGTWNRNRFHFLQLCGAGNLSMKGPISELKDKTETHSWGDRVGERPFL